MAQGRLLEIPIADFDSCVRINRNNLRRFAREFDISVALFAFLDRALEGTERNRRLHDFRTVAARDGALSVYHFGCSLRALKQQLPKSSFSGRADSIQIRLALKKFKADFPNIDDVRHGVAHAGELYATPEKLKLNQVIEPYFYREVFVIDELDEDKYSIGIDRKMVSVQLNSLSTEKLKAIIAMVDESFSALDAQDGLPVGNSSP